jgi:hypothetical protein
MWRLAVILLVVGCKNESVLSVPSPAAPAAVTSGSTCRGATGAGVPAPLSGTTGSALRPAHTFSIVARDP